LYSQWIQVAIIQSVRKSTWIIVELKPEATKHLVEKFSQEITKPENTKSVIANTKAKIRWIF